LEFNRVTCPHTSHQNGTADRKDKKIVETGLTLLVHFNYSPFGIIIAFTTVSLSYLINRLPTTTLASFIKNMSIQKLLGMLMLSFAKAL